MQIQSLIEMNETRSAPGKSLLRKSLAPLWKFRPVEYKTLSSRSNVFESGNTPARAPYFLKIRESQ